MKWEGYIGIFIIKCIMKHTLFFQKFITLNESIASQFVLVTAISDNHVKESLHSIAKAQQHMGGHKLILYDLGLNRYNQKQVCIIEVFPTLININGY